MIEKLFEKALHIEPPFYVKSLNFDETGKRLDIQIDFERGSVFRYRNEASGEEGEYKAYDTEEKSWRHLNFFEHECYLTCRVPRVKLGDGSVRMVHVPWEGKSLGFTLLFEALILCLCEKMPIKTVSKLVSVSDDKIWRLLEKYVGMMLEKADHSKVTAIGMDETAKQRGHDYITLFVDLKERKTIHIAPGKGSDTVADFVSDFKKHGGVPEAIKDVTCDMSPAFIRGVKDNLKEAKITFDKFHILKIINEAVDDIRRAEAKDNPLLKGTRYLFLKNAKNLTEKQSTALAALKLSGLNIKSLKALSIREAFQDIYLAKDESSFRLLLKKWYWWASHCRLAPMQKAARTIKAHWDGILRWKTSLINNGLLEGLNSLIQAAKAKARGFRTFRNFRIIAFLVTGKLNFSVINPAYAPL